MGDSREVRAVTPARTGGNLNIELADSMCTPSGSRFC